MMRKAPRCQRPRELDRARLLAAKHEAAAQAAVPAAPLPCL